MNKKVHNSLSILILNDLLNQKAIDKTIYDMAIKRVLGSNSKITNQLVKAS